MLILGLDGALKKSGWAVIEAESPGTGWGGAVSKGHGYFITDEKLPLARRLSNIRKEVIKLIKKFNPDLIVIEDTFSGVNQLTNARLNNVKGVTLLTAYETTDKVPICIKAVEARTCLGFKNSKKVKQEVYNFFKDKYKIRQSFEDANDITDAYTLAWYGVYKERGECLATKKPKKSRVKK